VSLHQYPFHTIGMTTEAPQNYKRTKRRSWTCYLSPMPPTGTSCPLLTAPHRSSLVFMAYSGGHAQSAQLDGASNTLPSCTERRCSFSAASRATPDPRPPSITAGKVLVPDKGTYYTGGKAAKSLSRLDLDGVPLPVSPRGGTSRCAFR
jgi:hypothetical protein